MTPLVVSSRVDVVIGRVGVEDAVGAFGRGSGKAHSERGDRGSEERRGVAGESEDEEEVRGRRRHIL